MANRERGEIVLVIGADRYVLRLTTNACCELETLTDSARNWDQVWDGMKAGSQRDVRYFMWVALRHHHPEIATDDPASLKTIGDLIDQAGGAQLLFVQLHALMLLNLEQLKKEGQPAQAGTRPRRARARTGGASTSRPSPSA